MFYQSTDVEETLRCSYCHAKFTDVIKTIHGCGEAICGFCYQDLRESLDESGEYKCSACEELHLMPKTGFTDNRGLLKLLKKKVIEKPLTEQAKLLKSHLAGVKEAMDTARSFDAPEQVNLYCEQLETNVYVACESAIKYFNTIQKDLLGEIAEYRKRCLETLDLAAFQHLTIKTSSGQPAESVKQKLDALVREVDAFAKKWDDYFTNVNVLASDSDISAALVQADGLSKRMQSLDAVARSQAFCGKLVDFKPKLAIFEDKHYLKHMCNLFFTYKSIGEVVIQPTSSHTLAGHTDEVIQVIFTPDGRLVSCSRDKSIKVWNAQDGAEQQELKDFIGEVYCVAMLPNGWLVTGSLNRSIKIWSLNDKKIVRVLEGHSGAVISIKVLNNGNVASYSLDDTIRVWNPYRATDPCLLVMRGHGNTQWLVRFGVLSNDYLVSCSKDQGLREECILKIWNPDDGQLVKSIATGLPAIASVLCLLNDQVALGFENGTIKVVDLIDKARWRAKEKAHEGGLVTCLLQLSNGNLLSSGRDADSQIFRSIKMWNFKDLTLLQIVATGHNHAIESMALSPDETLMATASRDAKIKLWPVKPKMF